METEATMRRGDQVEFQGLVPIIKGEQINPFGLSQEELMKVEQFHQETVIEPARARRETAQATPAVEVTTAKNSAITPNSEALNIIQKATSTPTHEANQRGRFARIRKNARRLGVACLAATVGVMGYPIVSGQGNNNNADARVINGDPEASLATTYQNLSDAREKAIDKEKAGKRFEKQLEKMTQGLDVSIGYSNIDWANANEQRGDTAFGFSNFKSRSDIKEFAHGNSAGSRALRAHLKQVFRGNPGGLKRAMSAEGLIPVQINENAVLHGTTYLVGNHILHAGERAVNKNDVMWVYAATNGEINGDASLRAACNQPGFDKYTPQSQRQVTSVEITPSVQEHIDVETKKKIEVKINNDIDIDIDIDESEKPDKPDKPDKPHKPPKKPPVVCVPGQPITTTTPIVIGGRPGILTTIYDGCDTRKFTKTTPPPDDKCPPKTVEKNGKCLHEPNQQDPNSNQKPDHTTATPTPGYTPDNAEKVVNQQENDLADIKSGKKGELDPTKYGVEETDGDVSDVGGSGQNTGGSKGGTVTQPDQSGDSNVSEYIPGSQTQGTNNGTKNGGDSQQADTGAIDDATSGAGSDPGGF